MGFNATGAAVTVGTSATQLCSASAEREFLAFTHTGGSEVFYGDASVSTTNWVFKTNAGDPMVVINQHRMGEVAAMSSWFGRVASGTGTVQVGRVEQ